MIMKAPQNDLETQQPNENNRMHKALAVISILLIAILPMAACSQTARNMSQNSAATTADAAETPAAETSSPVTTANADETTTAAVALAEGEFKIGLTQFADHPSLDNCREGFIAGLAQEGFVEGENVTFDYQNAQGDTGTANLIAQNYVAAGVDLICGIATPSAQASYNAAQSKDIPVIFSAVSDPVAAQLSDVTTKTGQGVTGTSDALPLEKQVKLIRALMPDAKTIGILYNTSEVNSESQIAELKPIAAQYGFELETIGVNAAADIPLAADNILGKVDCLNNLTDNLVVQNLPTILDKANAKGIPVFGSEEEQVKNGCVASEGIDYYNLGIQTGVMAAKVLKGEDINAMPYEIIKESRPFINSAVMETFGIVLPDDLKDTVTDLAG